MKPVLCLASFQYLKTGLYTKITRHPQRARVLSLPIAAQSFLSYPLLATAVVIEAIAMSLFNAIGLMLSRKDATVKDLGISLSVIGLAPALLPLSIVIGAVSATITLFGCVLTPMRFGKFACRFHEKAIIE